MDYVVGSVAALITGNVTPNRPRLMKRALTPTKHQPSPNVTPKSEFVEDRSIFLSPTMQKKKAIVKKSPKRIFQNPDLETTDSNEGNLTITSPKADKVKKHLKDELEGDDNANNSVSTKKSPMKKGNNKIASTAAEENNKSASEQDMNESTPKKKKKKQNSESEITVDENHQPTDKVSIEPGIAITKSPKKMKQRRKSVVDTESNKANDSSENIDEPKSNPKQQINKVNNAMAKEQNVVTESGKSPKKKNKKRKKKSKAPATAGNVEKQVSDETDNKENIVKEHQVSKKKNKKLKKSKGLQNKSEIMDTDEQAIKETQNDMESETTECENTVNPNAITAKESDSEHESDDEIESENEEINKKVLDAEKPEESSDEEDEESQEVEKKKVGKKEESGVERRTEEEIQRTLFVGNVLFTAKCKKEIKKIFSKHGQIETIRIRTVPIKDGSYTPKLALIKNELHPERTTVNVYIKFAQADSVEKALVENNTLLNEHHLRVSRSSSTGAEHDPRCSVFIGNLPFAMEDEALRSKFEKCGEIHSVRIIRDKKTNAGKGFGYVNFESKDAVELALALTEEDLTVKNRILRVKRCTQVTNKKKSAPIGKNQNSQQRGAFRSDNNQGQRGGFRNDNNQGQRGGFRNDNNQGQRGGFRNDNNQGQRGGFRNDNNQGQRGGFRNDNNQGQRGGFRSDNNQDNQQRGGFRGGNNQVNQQRSGFPSRNNQGNRQRNSFAAGNNQNQQRGGFNKFGNQTNSSQKDEEGREGAHRRVMNKRKHQDGAGGDGPPNKIQKDSQPNKEKKSRKEFVGIEKYVVVDK